MSDQERIARLEERAAGQDAWLKSIAEDVRALRDQANLGKGALVLLLKLGGWAALLIAAGWAVFDKFHK